MVLYSPEVEVPERTTSAPDGGDVREAAMTVSQNAIAMIVNSNERFFDITLDVLGLRSEVQTHQHLYLSTCSWHRKVLVGEKARIYCSSKDVEHHGSIASRDDDHKVAKPYCCTARHDIH